MALFKNLFDYLERLRSLVHKTFLFWAARFSKESPNSRAFPAMKFARFSGQPSSWWK
jgi:hypothetical protein